MQTLHTPRLILRAWRHSDVDDLYAYDSDPAVGPPAGWQPHTDTHASLQILRSFIRKDDTWAIQDRASGRVIGSIGLHEDTHRANPAARMIGYVLARPYWGRGLMSEAVGRALRFAFDELALDMVTVYHYPSNDRSRRVIEKCGFVYEGTLRRASLIYDGTVHDARCYSLTREEYTRHAPPQ